MDTDKDLNTRIIKNAVAPLVNPHHIDALMERVTYIHLRIDGTTTTVVAAVLDGSFVLAVEAASCVDARNFNAEIGVEIATKRAERAAKDKLWELKGWELWAYLQADAHDAEVADDAWLL